MKHLKLKGKFLIAEEGSLSVLISALFLVGYGICRFLAEFAREPDAFLGLLGLGLSMGQWLSIPMIIFGIYLIVRLDAKKGSYQ